MVAKENSSEDLKSFYNHDYAHSHINPSSSKYMRSSEGSISHI
jgi:hypothetical protein